MSDALWRGVSNAREFSPCLVWGAGGGLWYFLLHPC